MILGYVWCDIDLTTEEFLSKVNPDMTVGPNVPPTLTSNAVTLPTHKHTHCNPYHYGRHHTVAIIADSCNELGHIDWHKLIDYVEKLIQLHTAPN